MHLILVESSKKSEKVKTLLVQAGLNNEFTCAFTGGRIFDFKVDGSVESWDRVNPDIHGYLSKQIHKSESVIALTDADEQGEYIAFQVSTLANDHGKRTVKGDLLELTVQGLKNSLSKLRPINYEVVRQCHAERMLNLKVAKFGIEQGFGPISIHKLLMAEYLEQTATTNIAYLGGDDKAVVLTKHNTLGDVESNTKERTILPPSTLDVYAHSLIANNDSLAVVADRLQDLYEDSMLSYTRSDAHDWYPEAFDSIELLEESFGYQSNESGFWANCNGTIPHSAIYIIEPNCIHLNLPEVNCIQQLSLGVLGHNNTRSFVADIDINLLDSLAISAGGISAAHPELQILVGLKELDLYKPSTSGLQCHALANNLFDGHAIDLQAILSHRAFAKKHFPKLSDCIDKKTNPLHSIIQQQAPAQEREINNNLADRAFDELIGLGR